MFPLCFLFVFLVCGSSSEAMINHQEFYHNLATPNLQVLSYRRYSIQEYMEAYHANNHKKNNEMILLENGNISHEGRERDFLTSIRNSGESLVSFDSIPTIKEQLEMEKVYKSTLQKSFIKSLNELYSIPKIQNSATKNHNDGLSFSSLEKKFNTTFLLPLSHALDFESHLILLLKTLTEFPHMIPSVLQSSEPWCYYWVLHGLDILGGISEKADLKHQDTLFHDEIKETTANLQHKNVSMEYSKRNEFLREDLIEESMNLSQEEKNKRNSKIEHEKTLLKDCRDFIEKHLRRKILSQLESYYNTIIGGYSGGKGGQDPHILATYAALSSIRILEYSGRDKNRTLNILDLESKEKRWKHLYRFLMKCKNKDGSFRSSPHSDAESDIRICYGALVSAVYIGVLNVGRKENKFQERKTSHFRDQILDGLLLVDKCLEYIASLQTSEGGFTSEAFSPENINSDRESFLSLKGEAHAGFTYCAVASLAILDKFYETLKKFTFFSKGNYDKTIDIFNIHFPGTSLPDVLKYPNTTVWQSIDRVKLLEWCQNRQTFEGGFNGRCNKVVDSCYSFWIGATLKIIEDSFVNEKEVNRKIDKERTELPFPGYDSQALAEYILLIAQVTNRGRQANSTDINSQGNPKASLIYPEGGFCDKPPSLPDYYHTCYALSGLALTLSYSNRSERLRIIDPIFNLCVQRTESLFQ